MLAAFILSVRKFLALHLRKVMLNAANIYLFGMILTKCKYIYIQVISNKITELTEREGNGKPGESSSNKAPDSLQNTLGL